MAWQRKFSIGLAGAIVGATATITTGAFGYLNNNRELDIRMIEIALSILREDPTKSKITAARQWAVNLLDRYSGETLSAEAREELILKPLDIKKWWGAAYPAKGYWVPGGEIEHEPEPNADTN